MPRNKKNCCYSLSFASYLDEYITPTFPEFMLFNQISRSNFKLMTMIVYKYYICNV